MGTFSGTEAIHKTARKKLKRNAVHLMRTRSRPQPHTGAPALTGNLPTIQKKQCMHQHNIHSHKRSSVCINITYIVTWYFQFFNRSLRITSTGERVPDPWKRWWTRLPGLRPGTPRPKERARDRCLGRTRLPKQCGRTYYKPTCSPYGHACSTYTHPHPSPMVKPSMNIAINSDRQSQIHRFTAWHR